MPLLLKTQLIRTSSTIWLRYFQETNDFAVAGVKYGQFSHSLYKTASQSGWLPEGVDSSNQLRKLFDGVFANRNWYRDGPVRPEVKRLLEMVVVNVIPDHQGRLEMAEVEFYWLEQSPKTLFQKDRLGTRLHLTVEKEG